MAAGIGDKFTQATNGTRPNVGTLNSIKSIGASSLSADALTGWPTATAVHFILYQTNAAGAKVAGTQSDWKGIVSGNTITNLALKAGSDANYPIGTVVEASPTAAWAGDIVAGITAQHDQSGAHTVAAATAVAALLPAGSVAPAALATAIPSSKLFNPYKFSAYRAAALTPGAAAVVFDTKNFDTGNNYNTSTGQFTAPVTGYYRFSAALSFAMTGANVATGIALFKNGAVAKQGSVHVVMYPSTYQDCNTVSSLEFLTAGDIIDVRDPAVCGKPLGNTASQTWFSGELVSLT